MGRAFAQTAPDEGTRAAARDLATDGIAAYQAGDFPTASRKLEKAYRLFPTPTLGLWSARASYQLGHWVEAAERFREAQRASSAVGDSAKHQQAQIDATEELAALLPRIPAVTIELEDADVAGVVLQIDGNVISTELLGVRRPMNPGKHRVESSRGDARAQADVQLGEKDHQRVVLRLLASASGSMSVAPAASVAPATMNNPAVLPPPSTPRLERAEPQLGEKAWMAPVAISALAIGGASLAASGIAALVAQGKCAGGRCASDSDQDLYDPMRAVSSVTFWAGAALAVGGVTTWLLARHGDDGRTAQSTRLNITPFSVAVRGVF